MPVCPQCETPMTFLGEAAEGTVPLDVHTERFLDYAARKGMVGPWRVFACRNPECGCECHRFI
jgi:hypothetical protein